MYTVGSVEGILAGSHCLINSWVIAAVSMQKRRWHYLSLNSSFAVYCLGGLGQDTWLCLSFLFCKVEIILVYLPHKVVVRTEWVNICKMLRKYVTHAAIWVLDLSCFYSIRAPPPTYVSYKPKRDRVSVREEYRAVFPLLYFEEGVIESDSILIADNYQASSSLFLFCPMFG